MRQKKPLTLFLGLLLSFYLAPNINALNLTHMDDYLMATPEKTISMDFKNAQLNDVLKIFSQQSGLNFIATSEIASLQVNLYLDKVPVEDALERILSANNLTYELDTSSNIFLVKEINMPEIEMITRVYPLKHATVDSSKLNSTFSDDDSDSDSSSSSSSDSGSSSSSSSSSSGTDSSESGLLAALETVLSDEGTVTEDPRTNSLIVTDLPNRFPSIEQTIARLDVRIPQILIEVEMLDISKNASDYFGAKFGQTPLTFSGPSKTTLAPFNQNKLERTGIFSGPEYTEGTISFTGLNMALDFLKTRTDTKNLARPRILTLNNEKAEIKITTDEVIGQTSTSFSGDSAAQAETTAERSETGVSLVVTPQANLQTGEITMAIQPKVSEAVPSGIDNLKNPEVRSVKSIFRVNNGDTIVIGGLLRTETSNTRTQVPFVSKIPIVGGAFRHKESSEDQRELIVFITPHILTDNFIQPNKQQRQPIIREHASSNERINQINKDLLKYEQGF